MPDLSRSYVAWCHPLSPQKKILAEAIAMPVGTIQGENGKLVA